MTLTVAIWRRRAPRRTACVDMYKDLTGLQPIFIHLKIYQIQRVVICPTLTDKAT